MTKPHDDFDEFHRWWMFIVYLLMAGYSTSCGLFILLTEYPLQLPPKPQQHETEVLIFKSSEPTEANQP